MGNQEKLIIKTFGPIQNAEVIFNKVTIFVGEQGVGKSTIVKLYSLFTWLEKAITRHQVKISDLEKPARFKNKYCLYNNLSSLFKDETEITFHGLHYCFTYEKGGISITENKENTDDFNLAKVMYVPAERNILGSIDHPSYLKGLPPALFTFLEEYDKAKNALKTGFELPFNNTFFEYDALNDMPKIRNNDYEIKLSEASSGFQSTLPLLLVSKHISDMVFDRSKSSELTETEKKTLKREVEKIMGNENLTEEVKVASLKSLSAKYKYSRFLNIVEEPELNLYPTSQRNVLIRLIEDAKKMENNKLVMATHSPYVINYLTIFVKAAQLAKQIKKDKWLKEVEKIVPLKAHLCSSELVIYQVSNGRVEQLASSEGIPSDANFLNEMLQVTNDDFDRLLEIEEEIENGNN